MVRAVRALPEPYRTTLVARFLDDRTPADIAAARGIPASTVGTQVERGLAMLRKGLDREVGGRRAWLHPLLLARGFVPKPAAAGIGAATAGGTAGPLAKGVALMSLKKSILLAAAGTTICLATRVREPASPRAPKPDRLASLPPLSRPETGTGAPGSEASAIG